MTDSVSHVVGNLQDAVARMALKLDEIRRLHPHNYAGELGYCERCKVVWPCETMEIVERGAL